MKKLIAATLLSLAMVAATGATSFAEYANTNSNNIIDWYNIIDGVKERDYRSVSRNQAPFYFSFNGFTAEPGQAYEMTLRHAGNSDNDREQWKLYLEGDDSRFQLEDLVYSNDWAGTSEWLWVDQTFLVKAEAIEMVGANWSFVLEPGTKRYSAIDLDMAQISAVPVPGSLLILGSGLVILAGVRKRKRL